MGLLVESGFVNSCHGGAVFGGDDVVCKVGLCWGRSGEASGDPENVL